MSLLGLIVLVALMIPVVAILADSPIGRALGRRLEGPAESPPALLDLARKVERLESEVEDLHGALEGVREENQFLQRLLEDQAARRPTLPPPPNP
jgi:hypothetical protein